MYLLKVFIKGMLYKFPPSKGFIIAGLDFGGKVTTKNVQHLWENVARVMKNISLWLLVTIGPHYVTLASTLFYCPCRLRGKCQNGF